MDYNSKLCPHWLQNFASLGTDAPHNAQFFIINVSAGGVFVCGEENIVGLIDGDGF